MTNEKALLMAKQGLIVYETQYPQLTEKINFQKTVISALEKQIPEPPYLDKSGGVEDWFFCPNCNHNDVEYKDKYCRRCGQALDWRK